MAEKAAEEKARLQEKVDAEKARLKSKVEEEKARLKAEFDEKRQAEEERAKEKLKEISEDEIPFEIPENYTVLESNFLLSGICPACKKF